MASRQPHPSVGRLCRVITPLVFALAASVAVSAAAFGELAPRGVTPEDTYALPLFADSVVSPDGQRLVYTLARADRERDAYASALYSIDLAPVGSATAPPVPYPLTDPDDDASSPLFSPDGRYLAYIVEADDGSELWVAEVKQRPGRKGFAKAKKVVMVPEGIGDLAWSPDGSAFAFVRPDPPAAGSEDGPWVVTRSLQRADGDGGFLGAERSHVWVVERATGKLRQLTSGPWDNGEPQWSPDGKRIVFVSNRHPDPDVTDDTDLWLVDASGGEPRQLPSGPGPDAAPRWSHGGGHIAYLSTRRPNDYYQPARLLVLAVPTAGTAEAAAATAPVDLTGHLDAWAAADNINWSSNPGAPQWTANDRSIVMTLEHRGANRVVAVDTSAAVGTAPAVHELLGGAAVYDLVRLRAGGRGLVFGRTDPTHPGELYTVDLTWPSSAASGGPQGPVVGAPQRITALHDDWLATRTLVAPSKVTARNTAGDEVEAWLYPPRDQQPGKRYPLVLYIHGGPQGYDGEFFDYGLENQLFPAAGWAVLRVNYRGSTGYGEAFSRAIWGDWHSREHEDLMASLDAAIAQHSWIDPSRLGIGGWSYGGIMTVWAVGHTNRFAVGVPERFAFDYLSIFGEDQWFVWYLAELGSPYEFPDLYRRLSPGTYSANITTPLYLIANELDWNCPVSQVQQLYQRLKLRGKETEMVVYPGEPHSLNLPSHLVDRLERLLVWYGRHLDAPVASDAAAVGND